VNKKRILVCPLDWGIGHASRDVIIIKKLVNNGNEVILGGDGPSLKLLISEFPGLEVVQIPSHRFFYSSRFPAWFMILLQIPAFLNGILVEHRRLKKIIKAYHIDLVISDARYGLWDRKTPSVIITHQVKIRIPFIFGPFEYLINYINLRALEKFNYHWIPDFPDDLNISGLLSHQTKILSTSKYIGYISRFMDYPEPLPVFEQFEVLILLSGPEPQRSVFEKIVTAQLMKQNRRYVIIGGQIEEKQSGKNSLENNQLKKQSVSKICRRMPFISGIELYSMLKSAKYIICRSGYSTIMDLAAIRKTAFLVPTPGQTEQEYLASYLQKNGLFRFSDQKKFNLEKAIKEMDEMGSVDFSFVQNERLENALDDLLSDVKIY
jgi:uncharacterized protein (TIGR00661 family)